MDKEITKYSVSTYNESQVSISHKDTNHLSIEFYQLVVNNGDSIAVCYELVLFFVPDRNPWDYLTTFLHH